MLAMAGDSGLSIGQMKRADELVSWDGDSLLSGLDRRWQAMQCFIAPGLGTGGELPDGLGLPRRAAGLYRRRRPMAGLCAVRGGTPQQVESAAEIAL